MNFYARLWVNRAMKLKDFFPILDQLKFIQGVESELRLRRRNSFLATIFTGTLGILKVVKELSVEADMLQYFQRVFDSTTFTIKCFVVNSWYAISLQWDSFLDFRLAYDVLGFYIVLFALLIYFISHHTAFLFKISEEAFRYTFWIKQFTSVEDQGSDSKSNSKHGQNSSGLTHDIYSLLHHDLMDMLNMRIGRFSLLDEKIFEKDTKDGDPARIPPSHIQVDGHFAIRTRAHDDGTAKVIQVMPRVRIGPPGKPSVLTIPVEIELSYENEALQHKGDSENKNGNAEKADNIARVSQLNQEIYNQVVEQVYSKVASEIYKQIKSDIKQKIHLFPTKYLRAVALYYEAEDFSRSNTLDSYDYAIELYNEALRCYDISLRSVVSSLLLRLKFFRFGIQYESMHARTKIGYAKCLIYRRQISSLTGRVQNTLYEVPGEIKKVVNILTRLHNKFHVVSPSITNHNSTIDGRADDEETLLRNRLYLSTRALLFGKDTWRNKYLLRKLDKLHFDKLRKLLFDAHVVLALTYADIEAFQFAKDHLDHARATYPERCDRNALFLLTKARIEQRIELRIPLLIQASELAPQFEIAQYLLAKYSLQLFLARGEITKERAAPVVEEFKKVLKINPGNIASFAHLGYLCWLIDALPSAQKHFEQGKKTKAIVQQAFIGELNYGLARIAAKNGEFNRCYDLYSESLSSEPSLGTSWTDSVRGGPRTLGYYDFITDDMVNRYQKFKKNFEGQIQLAFSFFHIQDFADINSLKHEMDRDKYQILLYLGQNTDKSGLDCSEKVKYGTDETFVDKLNKLLLDAKFNQYIIDKNSKLREQFDNLKTKYNYKPTDNTSVAVLNRSIFEILYPKFIRKNDLESYFRRYSSSRVIRERSGKKVTIETLNKSYSYVLNDYANACLNYYFRFGNIKLLDEAIESFRKAIELDIYNGVAYYNTAIAVMWRYWGAYEGFKETKKYLEKADEFMPSSWSKVIISKAVYQMIEIFNRIEQEKKAITDDENRQKVLEKEIGDVKSQIFKKTQEEKDFFRTPLETRGQPFEDLQQTLNALESAIGEINHRLPKKRNDLKVAQRELENRFTLAIERTTELGELAAIIKGLGIDPAGSSVEEFISLKIGADRLNEKDLDVLRGWADLLSNNQSEESALKASIRLLEFVDKFIPQTFETDNILFNSYQRLEKLQIDKMLQKYELGRLIGEDELVEILGEVEAVKLLDLSPGEILTGDKDILDKIMARLKSPYFKISDIRYPFSLLGKLLTLQNDISIAPEVEFLKELQHKCYKREPSDSDLTDDLVKVLNRLIKTHLYKDEGRSALEPFSGKTQKLIRFEMEGELRGDDLIRFNRMFLEEIFLEEIAKSDIEKYRERISETIKNVWLASDPVYFLVLDKWAEYFVILPEFKQCLEEAIEYISVNFRNVTKKYLNQDIYHLKLSQAFRRNGRFGEAAKQIQKARENRVIKKSSYDRELKKIIKGEAEYLRNKEDWDGAISKYKEGLDLYPDDSDLKYRLDKLEKQYRNQRIANHYGKKWVDEILVVTPIAVEVASDLIPLLEGEGGGLQESILALIEKMRDRILREFGVKVPGIRFRGNEVDLSPGSYVFMINEIPLVVGTVSKDRRLFTGTAAELEALGIHMDETVDPLRGRPAYWIQEGDAAKLNVPGMLLWDAATYLIRHLEALLQKHLVEFLGHQEVYNLIDEKRPDKLDLYYEHPEDLTRLTAVLGGLISERVPITEFLVILEYVEQHQAESNVTDLINAVRLLPQVCKQLPGNNKITYYVKLSAKLEGEFQKAVHTRNGQYILAMSPEICQKVLSAVRDKITDQDKVAIIVMDKRLRPLVSQLLKLEFPNTPVIALDELLPPNADGLQGVAEIDFGEPG